MVDDAVFERESAQAGRLAQKRGDVRADRLRELRDWACRVEARTLIHVPKVVFDDTATLLLFGDRDAEVVVEVAVVRRGPREVPAHSSLVRLDVRERRTRDRREHHVVVHHVHDGAVEAVGDRRARRAAGLVLRPQHEVVDEELRAAGKQVREGCGATLGLEGVFLVDAHPRQLASFPRELVTPARVLLLRLQQLTARLQPLLACPLAAHGSAARTASS